MRNDGEPKQQAQPVKFPVTRLDHKHRKRENYTLLAGLPFAQDLCCIAGLRDENATSFIHEDVRLVNHQWNGGMKCIAKMYPSNVCMNHVTRVNVVETLSDIG